MFSTATDLTHLHPTDPATVVGLANEAEVERLRAQVAALLRQQQELMELLGTKRPEKLAHDVRNLLQERIFLEAACKQLDDK